jgi:hypothetical protein
MKRKSITKALFLLVLPSAVVGVFSLSACELIVDFDRTRIDAGQTGDTGAQPGPDSSIPDTGTDTSTTDAGDASSDASADAPDAD